MLTAALEFLSAAHAATNAIRHVSDARQRGNTGAEELRVAGESRRAVVALYPHVMVLFPKTRTGPQVFVQMNAVVRAISAANEALSAEPPATVDHGSMGSTQGYFAATVNQIIWSRTLGRPSMVARMRHWFARRRSESLAAEAE
jgi:hypothetical protein